MGVKVERGAQLGSEKAQKGTGAARGRRPHARRELAEELELADISVQASSVLVAAKTAALLAFIAVLVAAGAACVLWGPEPGMYIAPLLLAAPYIAGELVLTYPRREAARRADQILRHSTEGTSLMIMSLRMNASVPNAMVFASRRKTAFSRELSRCIWAVLMGASEGFEEALHRMATRWARHSGEFKAAMSAIVTASREGSEEGRRRALERANTILVEGAKRRIEEYALSLSTPSMVIFSLGILLPLMVGSFLPMLSWDLWSSESLEAPDGSQAGSWAVFQTVFLMNILFPLLAFSVAADATSRHPVELGCELPVGSGHIPVRQVVSFCLPAAFGSALSFLFLEGLQQSLALLGSTVLPLSLLLVSLGGPRPWQRLPGTGRPLEDMLFRAGARMVEGENLQSALNGVGHESADEGALLSRKLSFRSILIGKGIASAVDDEGLDRDSVAGLEAVRVVAQAAQKDERAAGLLAMDLATYLRDLGELESTMNNRLRPTTSMMNMTARYLGPVVLGVTYSIYLSLASVTGTGQGGVPPDVFFLVLGAFLAETNAVTAYFVTRVGGRRGPREVARTLGLSLLVSESIFAATALVTS